MIMLISPRHVTDDTPAVVVNGDYAESLVHLAYGQDAMLYMPLADNFEEVAEVVRWIRRTSTPIFDDCQAFRDELLFFDTLGRRCRGDVIMQRLPAGKFLYMKQEVTKQKLRKMLDDLQIEMKRLNITHRNLSPNCILVGKERMYITRIYQLEYGYAETNFRPLYTYIDQMDNNPQRFDYEAWNEVPVTSIERVYDLHEERMRIRIDGKYGFADVQQNIVVEAKYLWADDFMEGRSVVRTKDGAGVIDRSGNIIIEPRYENIIFEVDNGAFRAIEQGQLHFFNYNGEEFDMLDEERFGSDAKSDKSSREMYHDIKKEERKKRRQLKKEIEKKLCKEQNV